MEVQYLYPSQTCKFSKESISIFISLMKKEHYCGENYYAIHKEDRTEGFDDYIPCQRTNCKLKHIKNWLNLFVDYHNKELKAKVNRAYKIIHL